MKSIDKQLLNKLPDSVVTDHVQCEKELNKYIKDNAQKKE